MSIDPKIWGPSLWKSLFAIGLAYPTDPSADDQYRHLQFFYQLQFVLPCHRCRRNMSRHLSKIPIEHYLQNRTLLLEWLTKVHNEVNEHCGKPPKTTEQYLQRYFGPSLSVIEGFEALSVTAPAGAADHPASPPWLIWIVVVLVAVGGAAAGYYWARRRRH